MRVEWNGKKLTKKRALLLCWKLWEWVAENPGKDKHDWPEWKENKGKVKMTRLCCPCCEVGFNNAFDSCPNCPMADYWPRGCMGDMKSAYYLWVTTRGAKYARRIAAAAKRRYEKL